MPPIVLYLPPGPLLASRASNDHVARLLASGSGATVVEINYRSGIHHRYPTPVHDVLFGYDWVIKHLIPHRAVVRPGRSGSHVARIGVFGELLGGSLATMLGLTECRAGIPHIAAAAVNEPILDWVFPEADEPQDDFASMIEDEVPAMAKRKASRRAIKTRPSFLSNGDCSAITSRGLLSTRKGLFRKEAHMLDPFASPILFFRSPGVVTPSGTFEETLDEFEELALLDKEDFHRQQLKLSAMSNASFEQSHGMTDEVAAADEQSKPRKSSRRYPRTGSGLQLPNFRITHGQNSPLLDQGFELTTLLRRSMMRSASESETEAAHYRALEEAEQRMQLITNVEVALCSAGQTQELEAVGSWFREVL